MVSIVKKKPMNINLFIIFFFYDFYIAQTSLLDV